MKVFSTLAKLLVSIALFAIPSLGQQVAVSGNLVDTGLSDVSSSNTYVRFELQNYSSQPRVTGSGVIVRLAINCTQAMLDAGTCLVVPNSSIVPTGTFWRACFFDKGTRVRCLDYTVSGAFNINTQSPITTAPASAAVQDYVLKNPTGTQTVDQPAGTSLDVDTFNGTNINTSPMSAPTRIGDMYLPGTATGTATAPLQAPFCQEDTSVAPTSFNTGALAAGTYYAVFFLLNKNGATTASPVSTGVTVAGPTDKIFCRPVSYEYAHGTYALGLGMSTSSTGPFYLQTPARVQLAIANNGITYDGSGTITVTFGSAHPFWYTGPITISGATGCATDPNGAYTVNAPPPSSTTLTVAKAGGAETCGGANAVAYYDPGMAVGSQFSGAAKFIYAGNVGAADFIVTNLVTSGDVPPTTNTATIDALQVAVNQTLTLSGSANVRPSRVGKVALRANTTYTQTTPLICFGCSIEGAPFQWFTGSLLSFNNAPLITSSWNDATVGTLMIMGQYSNVQNVNVSSTGTSNGIMYVQGDHSGNGSRLVGVTAGTNTASTTTAAIRMYKMGVSQHHKWDGVSTSGGDVNVWLGNANVSLLEWLDGRANCASGITTSSAIRHTAGPVDIYRGGKGISDPVASAVTLRVRRVPMENCKGIGVDFGGGYLALEDNTHVADAAPTAGTVAGLRLWSDNWSSGATGSGFRLANGASLGHSGFANGAIYMGPGSNDYNINGMIFESATIAPNSGGIAIDGSNVFGRSVTIINTSGITCNPNSTNGKIVNVTSAFSCYQPTDRSADSTGWNEVRDRLVISPNGARSSRSSITSPSGILTVNQADDTTFQFKTRHATNGGLAIRGSLQVGAEGNSSSRNFGIDLPNTYYLAWRNAANSANIDAIQIDGSNILQLCGTNCASVGFGTKALAGITTLNMNNQLTNTLAIGTAPLVITSTTKVANLNVDSLDDKDWAAPAAIGTGTPAAGTFTTLTGTLLATATNCSSSAAPAVCAAAPAGSVVIAAGGTTVTVNTTAVTANSQILVFEDSSLGTKLSVTCNTTIGRNYAVTARTAATSFVITTDVAPVTNPACLSYLIMN